MVLTRPFTHRPSLMTSTSSLRGEAKEEHNVLLLKTAWQDKVELQEEAGTMNYVTHAMAVLWISRLRGLHLHQCFANGFVYKTTEDGLVHFFLYKTSLYKATVYLLSWRTESRIWDITSVLVLYWFLLVFDPDTLGTPLEVQSTQSLSETSRQISTFFPFRRSAAERITRWSCVHGQRMSQSSRGHMIRRTDLISRGHMIRRTDSDLMLVWDTATFQRQRYVAGICHVNPTALYKRRQTVAANKTQNLWDILFRPKIKEKSIARAIWTIDPKAFQTTQFCTAQLLQTENRYI